jgi:hypothetical protein
MISDKEIEDNLEWMADILAVSMGGLQRTRLKPNSAKDVLRRLKDEDHNVREHWNHPPDRQTILTFFDIEYEYLKAKLKHTMFYVREDERRIVQKKWESLLNLEKAFFFKYRTKIITLAERFCSYQIGRNITANRIQNWLIPFGNEERMELALILLNSVEMVRDDDWIIAMANSFAGVANQSDNAIILTQLLSILESQPRIESLMSKGIERKGISLSLNQICDNLKLLLSKDNHKGKALFLADDFIGSSAKQLQNVFLELINDPSKKEEKIEFVQEEKRLTACEVTKLKTMQLYISCYYILDGGEKNLQEFFNQHGFNVAIINASGKTLKRCFENNLSSNGNTIFDTPEECKKAKQLCYEVGFELMADEPDIEKRKRDSLGYRDDQQLLTFSNTTPTNTLPIFWKRGIYNGVPWVPLFPRPEEKQH